MPKSIFARPGVRWAVPGGVIVAVVGAAVLVPVFAETDADLPEITAAELLTEMANAEPSPLSGTLVHTADAGIPEIPGVTAGRSSGVGSKAGLLSSVLSGSTTARIWYTDSEHLRLALQDDLVENDIVRNGDDFWVWSSAENTAIQFDLGMLASLGVMGGLDEEAMKPHDLPTPDALTDEMLEEFDHTDFTVDGTTVVADRAAYEAVITPSDEGSLIGSIRIAVDGEKFEPLRIQVFSTSDGSDPSLELGYTSVSFSEPDASVYEFSPPEGATVEEFNPLTWWLENSDHTSSLEDSLSAMPTVVGEGWASVLVVPNISFDDLMSVAPGEASEGLTELLMTQFTAVSGEYGAGVAYESDLFSVMLLDDGTLLVGAVTIETLEQAAADA